MKVKREEFESFCISCNPFGYTSPKTTISPTNILPPHDPIKDLIWDVKRDTNIFPKLKDDKKQNDWYNRTKAQARLKFIDEIFDINYKPGSVEYIKKLN